VTVDTAGDVFIADSGNNRVVEVSAGGGLQTTVGSGFLQPKGVAVDAAGDVFIADTGNNQVVEVPAGGGPHITIAKLNQPRGVSVDAAGQVFIANTGTSQVLEVAGGGGFQTTVGTGLKSPAGVGVDVPVVRTSAGNAVQLQATVQSSPPATAPAATGALTFADGTTPIGSATLSATTPDTASLTTTALAAGIHHLTATYGGDATHPASPASAPITVFVVAQPGSGGTGAAGTGGSTAGTSSAVTEATHPAEIVTDLGSRTTSSGRSGLLWGVGTATGVLLAGGGMLVLSRRRRRA
jgi:hypothetical protein